MLITLIEGFLLQAWIVGLRIRVFLSLTVIKISFSSKSRVKNPFKIMSQDSNGPQANLAPRS